MIKLGNNDITLKVGSADVSAAYLGSVLVYSGGTPHDYSQDYFTIVSEADNNTITLKNTGYTSNDDYSKFQSVKISASTDNGQTWSGYSTTTAGTKTITLGTLNTGDEILLKGENNKMSNGSDVCHYFETTGNFKIQGNIMSLLYGDNFINNSSLPNVTSSNTARTACFGSIFRNSKVTTAENLILPATEAKHRCYYHMFQGCTNLTTAPVLPATTLARECYQNMFRGCTSLTTAPELPAETLTQNCYANMFQGCTSLNYIKCLATSITGTNYWTSNVASSGTFVKDANATWTTGVNGIPNNWSVVNNT